MPPTTLYLAVVLHLVFVVGRHLAPELVLLFETTDLAL